MVNLHEAKTHLSRLVQRAAAGEEIVIAKAGVPMARLVPYTTDAGPRRLGVWKGRVEVAGDFFDADGAIEETFVAQNGRKG